VEAGSRQETRQVFVLASLVGAAVVLQIETAAASSFSIALDAIWRFAVRPKERRDCVQKDIFCARLDQMARLLDRHPVWIGAVAIQNHAFDCFR
jgi:hypothetical protein